MIANPHDAMFKAVFGQPEHARGTLRSIVPPALAEALAWSTLTLRPGSFVDTTLSHQHTDLLYSVGWRGGGEALVHLLFEHQSAPPTDGLMAHRLLRYQVRIWERWRADHPKARTLPAIVAIVMYHGEAPWLESRAFDDLLEVPAELRPVLEPHLVRFTYLLHDLSRVPDDELREGAMRTALAKLVAMCFKYARTRADFLQILSRWMSVAREVLRAPHGLEALALVVRYILEVNEHVGPEVLQALLERDLGPEAKEAIMTAGQQIFEQGLEQGLERGRQQGLERGLEQGLERGRQQGVEALLRLVRERFGASVAPSIEQQIRGASLEQILAWTPRVLSAATIADVFAR